VLVDNRVADAGDTIPARVANAIPVKRRFRTNLTPKSQIGSPADTVICIFSAKKITLMF
jgi:hypothetical protein